MPGQLKAVVVSQGEHERRLPATSGETVPSAYECAQKRPGPEYLHYLCAVYRADPPDLGYPDACFCGRGHRGARMARPGAAKAVNGRAVAAAGTSYPAFGPGSRGGATTG